ncbi:MAG: hypothetical protein K6357_00915 [Elusimicrobiota bacterium]
MEINENVFLEDIMNNCPDAINVFINNNLNVMVCGEVVWDTLGNFCKKNNVSLDKIISELKEECLKSNQ